MRGTVAKEDLQFDPEIERTAKLLRAQAKEAKRLAGLAQPESLLFIPSPTGSVHTISLSGSSHSSAPSSPKSEPVVDMANEGENNDALPMWVNPRRLANLGNRKVKSIELKSGLINLITHNQFTGMDHEDPYKHLTNFYVIAGTLGMKEDEEEGMFVQLFPHSLIGKAKEWYIDQPTSLMENWTELEKAFQERFFPEDRHLEAKTSITTFAQGQSESLCEAWERYKSLLRNCPKHGFDSQMQLYLFRQGLQDMSKTMLDASAGGSIALKNPADAVKIINQMALNTRKSSHNRNPQQRKAGILELEANDAVLAQNKLLTQQIEAMQKEMRAMPKQILESLKQEGGTHQVNTCELCTGDHPTDFCPTPGSYGEEEVNYVGNQQQRPNQPQGQQAGNSNQGQNPSNFQPRYPSNNFQRQNQYNQSWRTPYNYQNPQYNQYQQPYNQYQQPFNNQYQNPQQNNPQQPSSQSTEETLKQFMQLSIANQKNTDASIKGLETQVGQLAQQMAQGNQQGGPFTANTQPNPKT
jgi:hypothetical protein